MTFIEYMREVIRLARLQVAAFGETTEERALYLCAISVFEDHLDWHPANHNCAYLAGVVALLRKLDNRDDPDVDPDLGLAVWNTLGLVDDGAEWPERLEAARQELRDKGVTV